MNAVAAQVRKSATIGIAASALSRGISPTDYRSALLAAHSRSCGLLALYPLQRKIDSKWPGARRARGIDVSAGGVAILAPGAGIFGLTGGHLLDARRAILWTPRLAHAKDFALLGTLLDTRRTLDPHLLVAYRFGSLFLAGKRPEGAGSPASHLSVAARYRGQPRAIGGCGKTLDSSTIGT